MKKINWIITGVSLALLFLTSCSNTYIYEISKSHEFNLNPDNSKTAIIFGSEDIVIEEFVKTFNNNYKENRDFVNDYISLLSDKLQNEKVFAQAKPDLSNQWSTIRSYSSEKQDLVMIDSLHNLNADYIINVSNFNISNRVVTRTNFGGSNMPASTSSTEYCIVKARFEISDRKTRKNILEFYSKGESTVFLFAFKAAFNNAMKNSIDHAVSYLKTGKKEF